MRTATLLAGLVIVVSGCNAKGAAPTAPTPAALVPVVRSVTVDRTRVEAGTELTLTAALDNADTMSPSQFAWTVTPAGGTLTNEGATARWRAPVSDPVPGTYVFSLAVLGSGTATTSGTATITNVGAAKSPPVTVNDAKRETQAHATAFLSDLADANVSPEFCVRNFTDACGEGKRAAIADIAALRAKYSAATTSYTIDLFLRSVEWANCTGSDRSAICALLVYVVDTTWVSKADGGSDHMHGYQYLRAVYEGDRWWLCSSRFADSPNAAR